MKAIEWHTETWVLSELQPYHKNPRHFTEKGMRDLGKSLAKFGLADYPVINTDGVIIGGHARIKILIERGDKDCQCNVPNRKLTDKEVEELNIRLNANEAGEFDTDILANEFELEELQEWGLNIPSIGVDYGGLQDPTFGEKQDITTYKLYVESKHAYAFKKDITELIESKYPTTVLQNG